jgi:amino acid transporter
MNGKRRLPQTIGDKIWHGLLGRARDPHDPNLAHQLSLVAFLAWVGLGVDGLSSSAYGPDEAYRVLGEHYYLGVALALATAFTVCIISFAYGKLIEHFPHGGGGYVVATQLLGKPAGVVSGSALLVDYILTITVSIASGGDAIFSLIPVYYHPLKLPLEFVAILFLILMNLRGLKESVSVIVPFFMLFVITHIILIFGGIFSHVGDFPVLVQSTVTGYQTGAATIGKWGLFLLFLRAYSMGGGTYTGIEAVSNGVASLREPRVVTAKKTMMYLTVSLSLTAGGLLICYMLFNVHPVEGQTLNAVLAQAFAGDWTLGGFKIGYWFVFITILSESILLLVAAQTGFIDGPRVMANMAVDNWLPRRFASLSDRLTMQNGILLMGVAAMATLLFTRGRISILVVMYSINVFITFSMSQLAMIKFWFTGRKDHGDWKKNITIHIIGFCLCFTILMIMVIEKFAEGAWATVLLTSLCIALCYTIRNHYKKIGQKIKHIEHRVKAVTKHPEKHALEHKGKTVPEFDPKKPTAAILVGGYSRLGRRSLLAVLRFFPNTFHNIVFISIGVINSEFFKKGEVDSIEKRTEETLKGYCSVANRLGLPARYAFRVGTDVVSEASELCLDVSKQYPHAMFFAGEIIFEHPTWFDRILHNETAYAIQRQIRFAGLPMVILPLVLHEDSEHEHEHHPAAPTTPPSK